MFGVDVDRRLVLAVGLDGLAEQGDLPDAALGVGFNLAGDLVDGSGALAAATEGDDAVGAELVAAFDDGDECGRSGLVGEHVGPTGGPEFAAVVFGLGEAG